MQAINAIRGAVSGSAQRVRNFYQQRRLVELGIGSIQAQIADTEAQLTAAENGLRQRQTPSFKWLFSEYLPARRRMKLEARCDIPPDDAIKQAMAQGQINEIDSQRRELEDMFRTVEILRERLDTLKAAEAKWHQSHAKA